MTTIKENYALEELAQELDSELGSIEGKVITLNDLKTSIATLRIEMDSIDEQNAQAYFKELYRTVRLIDDLTQYTVNSLNIELEEAQETKNIMFHKIVKGL